MPDLTRLWAACLPAEHITADDLRRVWANLLRLLRLDFHQQ